MNDRDRQRDRRRTKGPILFRNKKSGALVVRTGPAYCKSEGLDGHRMMVYQNLMGIRYVLHEKEFEEQFETVSETATVA